MVDDFLLCVMLNSGVFNDVCLFGSKFQPPRCSLLKDDRLFFEA
jgi:hypothetical protein